MSSGQSATSSAAGAPDGDGTSRGPKKRRLPAVEDELFRLRCLGFCGADDTVKPAQLKAISDKHEWVEWGVLFRDEKRGLARFASDSWLTELSRVNSPRLMRLAGVASDGAVLAEGAEASPAAALKGARRMKLVAVAEDGTILKDGEEATAGAGVRGAQRLVGGSVGHVECDGLLRPHLWEGSQVDRQPWVLQLERRARRARQHALAALAALHLHARRARGLDGQD